MAEHEETKELQETIFQKFTAILAVYDLNPADIDQLMLAFSNRWSSLPMEPLQPLRKLLRSLSLPKYLEKKDAIQQLCLQASEDLRLLIG